jgi:hypothetical protein
MSQKIDETNYSSKIMSARKSGESAVNNKGMQEGKEIDNIFNIIAETFDKEISTIMSIVNGVERDYRKLERKKI